MIFDVDHLLLLIKPCYSLEKYVPLKKFSKNSERPTPEFPIVHSLGINYCNQTTCGEKLTSDYKRNQSKR